MSDPGPSPSYTFDDPALFTVGTVGEIGNRLFFLQAGEQGRDVVSVKVEKQQVAALGVSLGQLLRRLRRPGTIPDRIEPLEPVEPVWAVARLAVSYDSTRDRVVLVADELVDYGGDDIFDEEPGIVEDDEAGAGDALARLLAGVSFAARLEVAITREHAAAIAMRAVALVAAGRPPCPLCGHPLEASGHACPRTNGHRPPSV